MTGTVAALDDVIRTRRWRHALLTTYTLSLTFFESVVLRALQAQGCGDIWVVADADGYRASLMERRSTRVGQEYRLIPLALPRGVFHPKCVYLAGEDGDLLLVGSGNLTFGGYGRNLEVLEILDASVTSESFLDFAQFLDALRARTDLLAPDLSWASAFADLARVAARSSPAQADAARQPRLIHTITRSALDQLAERCMNNRPGRELLVLSPFHDLDGAAVRRLADRTGCEAIAVGLGPRENDPSPFNFPSALSWGKAIRAVRPSPKNDRRGLHAKWIQIQLDEGTLVLTGSVNATTQSLCTTNNVEVGVVRLGANVVTNVTWRDVETPTDFVARPVRTPGLGQSCVAHASIQADGTLVGRVLATFDPTATWAGNLILARGDTIPFSARLAATGDFEERLPHAERLAFATALQIELSWSSHIARGWVQMDEVLNMPRLSRIGVTSLLRLINREETEDDDLALLDYFAFSSSRHLATFSKAIKLSAGTGETPDGREPDVTVELEELAPDAAVPDWNGDEAEVGSTAGAALERVLAQLRKRLISEPSGRGPAGGSSAGDGDEELNARDLSSRVESNFEFFGDRMRELAEESESSGARRSALVIWFEVSMHMLLRRLKDRTRAVSFLREWFDLACSEARVIETVSALEQHVFTAAALLVHLAAADTDRVVLRQCLHEALERFAAGDVEPSRAKSALHVGERIAFAAMLMDGVSGRLENALLEVLATRTPRQDVQDAIVNYNAGYPPDPASPLLSKKHPLAAQLRTALSKRGRASSFKEQRGDAAVCAHCFFELNTRAEQDLERYRLAECTSCRRWTFRILP